MNKPNIKKKPLRGLVSVCAIAALAGALLATTAGVASADYGPGALYQIELVAGDNGASFLPVGQRGAPPQGGGIWLWIALSTSVILYIPLYFWAEGRLSVDEVRWYKFHISEPDQTAYARRRAALGMLL